MDGGRNLLGGDDLITKAITAARLAASYRYIASSDPACEAGFTKLAERQSGVASAALNDWLTGKDLAEQGQVLPGGGG